MSFIDELTKIGVDSVKDGALGYDDMDQLKRKVKAKWEGYDGGREQAKKKSADQDFFLYWKFTLDSSLERCRPSVEQVKEALPDELKITDKLHGGDAVTVSVDEWQHPAVYSVTYSYETRVNKCLEEEGKKQKREREEADDADDAKKAKANDDPVAVCESARERLGELEQKAEEAVKKD